MRGNSKISVQQYITYTRKSCFFLELHIKSKVQIMLFRNPSDISNLKKKKKSQFLSCYYRSWDQLLFNHYWWKNELRLNFNYMQQNFTLGLIKQLSMAWFIDRDHLFPSVFNKQAFFKNPLQLLYSLHI